MSQWQRDLHHAGELHAQQGVRAIVRQCCLHHGAYTALLTRHNSPDGARTTGLTPLAAQSLALIARELDENLALLVCARRSALAPNRVPGGVLVVGVALSHLARPQLVTRPKIGLICGMWDVAGHRNVRRSLPRKAHSDRGNPRF